MSSDFEDADHTEYFALEKPGQESVVVSRAAFTLSTAGLTQSVRDGTPGFVSDEYLAGIAAETTLTAMELVTAGEWERVEGGYRIIDEQTVEWVRRLQERHQWDYKPGECPGHEGGPNSGGACRRCGLPLT